MKRIPLLILVLFILTSCMSKFVNLALEKVGVFDEKCEMSLLKNDKKKVYFIEAHHIGREEYYLDISKKVDSLQKDGYIVFYESVKRNSDSLINDTLSRKLRKLTGIANFTYYDTITNKIGGKLKYKGEYKLINQPKYPKMKVDQNTSLNIDVDQLTLISEFEKKYGKVQLSECDYETKLNSEVYNCEKLNKELSEKFKTEFVINYRNKNLANEVQNSKENKILIIYGENHLNGFKEELRKINPNWN